MNLLTDLTADNAPDMTNDPYFGEEGFLLNWRPLGFDAEMENWRVGLPVDKENLSVRMSSVKGVWEDAAEHECLPDFSCCNAKLGWELDVRESFMSSTDEEKQVFLAASLSILAKETTDNVHVCGEDPTVKH